MFAGTNEPVPRGGALEYKLVINKKEKTSMRFNFLIMV